MGGRGSSSNKGNNSGTSQITDSEYGLLESSKYGDHLTSASGDKEAISFGEKIGMNKNEINLIHSYTGELYHALNSDIRAGKVGVTTFVKDKMNKALDKITNHKGEVYRGLSVENTDNFIKGLKSNTKGFKFDSFTSTSTSMKQASSFLSKGKNNVIFSIKSKTGKNIQHLSQQKSESEILFKAGTKFKFISWICLFGSGYSNSIILYSYSITSLPLPDCLIACSADSNVGYHFFK